MSFSFFDAILAGFSSSDPCGVALQRVLALCVAGLALLFVLSKSIGRFLDSGLPPPVLKERVIVFFVAVLAAAAIWFSSAFLLAATARPGCAEIMWETEATPASVRLAKIAAGTGIGLLVGTVIFGCVRAAKKAA